jgi:DNA modification methylase
MLPRPITENSLFYGDNLPILREHIPSESVDLIYLDPPFNSNRSYNVLFKDESGTESEAQITAFEDTWHWDLAAEQTYTELSTAAPDHVAKMVGSLRDFIGTNQMMAYLVMMTVRLIELHRVLKPTGSLYLHCDPGSSHYLKIVLDTIFGPERFLNEITWKRTTAHNDPKRYGRIGDRLLFYSKTATKIFNHVPGHYSEEQLSRYKYRDERGPFRAENLTAPHYSPTRTIEWRGTHPGADRQWRYSIEELERLYGEGRILLQQDGRPRKDGYKMYLDEAGGPALQDIWFDIGIGPTAEERLGYPTQKPLALLERIISASSDPDCVILDAFCGCGTAIVAAQKLGRKWIGIDITHLSIALLKYRLEAMFPGTPYKVVGEPQPDNWPQKTATNSNGGRSH